MAFWELGEAGERRKGRKRKREETRKWKGAVRSIRKGDIKRKGDFLKIPQNNKRKKEESRSMPSIHQKRRKKV